MNKPTTSVSDEIWSLIRETQKSIRELTISQKETDKQIKKTEALFNTKWGKLVESLVEGDLLNLLNKQGVKVSHTLTNLKREQGEQRFEFDIVAVNGEEVVVVEVKTTLEIKDIDYFIEKLQNFTDFAPEYSGKKIYGTVAYIKANQSSNINAEKRGLFVIKATGNSASIINKKDFKPKVFS